MPGVPFVPRARRPRVHGRFSKVQASLYIPDPDLKHTLGFP